VIMPEDPFSSIKKTLDAAYKYRFLLGIGAVLLLIGPPLLSVILNPFVHLSFLGGLILGSIGTSWISDKYAKSPIKTLVDWFSPKDKKGLDETLEKPAPREVLKATHIHGPSAHSYHRIVESTTVQATPTREEHQSVISGLRGSLAGFFGGTANARKPEAGDAIEDNPLPVATPKKPVDDGGSFNPFADNNDLDR
jgi:hypothetical protein